MRATCATARITMLFWDEKLDKILKDNNIGVDEGARYMDDIRLILDALQEGWRWIENGLYYSPEWEMEDKKLEETATQRTSRIMKDIMNSVLKFLNLKMEIGDDFENNKLPTLDLEIWVQPGGRVLYQHYEKPMNTNLVIQKSSALSENTKVSSLTQEVVRVLLNCSEDLDDSSRVEYLNKLSTKIRTSGYNTLYIRKVMINGIKTYERKLGNSKLDKSHKNYAPLHQPKTFNATKRREAKLLAKNNWYRGGKGKGEETEETGDKNAIPEKRWNRKPSKGLEKEKVAQARRLKASTVMFVPWTRKGRLAGRLKEEEDRLAILTGFRIKFRRMEGQLFGDSSLPT